MQLEDFIRIIELVYYRNLDQWSKYTVHDLQCDFGLLLSLEIYSFMISLVLNHLNSQCNDGHVHQFNLTGRPEGGKLPTQTR